MSPTIAILPRATGKGRALLSVVAELLFAASAEKAAPKVATANTAKELNLWRLYRMTGGYDSVSPEVVAELRKRPVG